MKYLKKLKDLFIEEIKTSWKYYTTLLVILLITLFFNLIYSNPVIVDGNSMNPTLHDLDFGYIRHTNTSNPIERFDVCVIDLKTKEIVKRAIGLPFEKVEYKDNVLYINDEVIDDPYNFGSTTDFCEVLGENEYFCLGDNRTNSADSRYYGPFAYEQIVGNGLLILFPFSNFGVK